MRTTLTLDPDVMNAAREIANARSQSIGEVISELARKGLEARRETSSRNGFPVFEVRKDAPLFGSDTVRGAEDVEGQTLASM
jgi:hypothetical protein